MTGHTPDETGGRVLCRTCGHDHGPEFDEQGRTSPTPEHCGHCPPTRCEDCGGICDWQSGALCSCWVTLEGKSMPEIKALFAEHDDELSIDPDATP